MIIIRIRFGSTTILSTEASKNVFTSSFFSSTFTACSVIISSNNFESSTVSYSAWKVPSSKRDTRKKSSTKTAILRILMSNRSMYLCCRSVSVSGLSICRSSALHFIPAIGVRNWCEASETNSDLASSAFFCLVISTRVKRPIFSPLTLVKLYKDNRAQASLWSGRLTRTISSLTATPL